MIKEMKNYKNVFVLNEDNTAVVPLRGLAIDKTKFPAQKPLGWNELRGQRVIGMFTV